MNKTVWITGASSGIGEALAYEYSKLGARLLISARREAALEKVKENCQNPDKVSVLPLDLEKYGEMPQKVIQALELVGSIDILINNGGVSQRSLAAETDISVDKKLMDINYLGTVALSKAILPHFVQKKSGHIGTVTSLTGKFGTPLRSSYAASKHALHGFFDSLRAEHHAGNLRITMICPGFVQTNVSKNALTADGSPQNTMDEATANGITPQKCAKGIVSAIKRNQKEVYLGKKEVFGVYIKRFFPNVFAKMIRKASVV